jgi:hypothetical protein
MGRVQTHVGRKAQSEIGLAEFQICLDRTCRCAKRFAKVYNTGFVTVAMSRRAESHCIDAQAKVVGLQASYTC